MYLNVDLRHMSRHKRYNAFYNYLRIRLMEVMIVKSQKQLAREWVRSRRRSLVPGSKDFLLEMAAMDFIMENTEPDCMADVVWRSRDHHLAGATKVGASSSESDTAVVMIDTNDEGMIYAIDSKGRGEWYDPNDLVLSGVRYSLNEDK